MLPTLKPHNFFAIELILKILDVPESSGSLLSHNRIHFPGRFHESSSNRGSDFRRFWCFALGFHVHQPTEILKNIQDEALLVGEKFSKLGY